MKKNKLNYDATLKQIDMMMPDNLKGPYKNSVQVCKDSGKNDSRYQIEWQRNPIELLLGVGIKDACEAAAAIFRCMMKENPEMLFP